MQRIEAGLDLRGSKGKIRLVKRKLAITKEGFIYRASVILNNVDEDLRNEINIKKFKTGIRRWVLENIPTKPSSKFKRVENRLAPRSIVQVNNSAQQDIRQFLIDRLIDIGAPLPISLTQPTPSDRPPPTPERDQASAHSILRYFTPVQRQQGNTRFPWGELS